MLGAQTLTGYMGSIPGGLAGTKATLKIMVNIARRFLKPPPGTAQAQSLVIVRTTAQQLVQGCGEKDYWCEASTLQVFVRDRIRYVRDMRSAETIQFPDKTLQLKSGDCDDKAMLFNALAGSIGFPTRFAAIGVRGEPFSHVMAQADLPAAGGYVNAETILDDPPVELGWEPPDATTVMYAHCQ
jgi:transglutaminase-like putative cysteine protease